MSATGTDEIERALAFARWAYCANDDRDLEHPWDTAALLAMSGFPDTVVAAGLLHDVVEDTAATPEDIAWSVDREVAELVRVLSENPAIASYDERKADLRRRVREAGGDAAAIFAADKLARLRSLRQSGRSVPDEKLEHYIASLITLAKLDDPAPFLDAISQELIGAPG
jgi:(p)ppGpp synthase/HD superfamily hydrolase